MSAPRRKRSKKENSVEIKMDMMSKLPDELLCQVLSYFSLRDKLRSEAVSKKFQRCIFDKPFPLEICAPKHLNGHILQVAKFADTVRSLARKAKFSNITVWAKADRAAERWMDSILYALTFSDSPCLSLVEAVELDTPCRGAVLEEFLSKCGRLSSVQFDFAVRPWYNSESDPDEFSARLDVAAALNGKPIKRLELALTKFSHEELLQLFRSLKPNTLQSIELSIFGFPLPDIVGLMKDLAGSAWAALDQIKLTDVDDSRNFFAALDDFPKLRKCQVKMENPNGHQLVPAMVSLLNNWSPIEVQFKAAGPLTFLNNLKGCEIMNQIRQIQKSHPVLQVAFSAEKLILVQGNVTFKTILWPSSCAANCVQCHSFYPNVIEALADAADDGKNTRMEEYKLDQCRIGSVVERINEDGDGAWQALSVETNQARGTATITFKRCRKPRQFKIRLRYGPCFSSSCIQCAE